MKLLPLVTAAVASSLLLVGITASADDGEIFRRQTSSSPGTVADPEPEGEHAFIKLMNFRVPARPLKSSRACGLLSRKTAA